MRLPVRFAGPLAFGILIVGVGAGQAQQPEQVGREPQRFVPSVTWIGRWRRSRRRRT